MYSGGEDVKRQWRHLAKQEKVPKTACPQENISFGTVYYRRITEMCEWCRPTTWSCSRAIKITSKEMLSQPHSWKRRLSSVVMAWFKITYLLLMPEKSCIKDQSSSKGFRIVINCSMGWHVSLENALCMYTWVQLTCRSKRDEALLECKLKGHRIHFLPKDVRKELPFSTSHLGNSL